MREQELYDKFFIDEEYELENAPAETYSYQSGWNNALKRASIILRNEIRPQGEWIDQSQGTKYPCECSECHTEPFCDDDGYVLSNFCPNCGADMRGGRE